EGEMPLDFRQRFKDRYDQNMQETALSQDRSSKEKRLFITFSTHALDLFISSGKVCYGDPISLYCDSLLGVVLGQRDTLRKNLRVYALRSNEVNAFTTHQGVIVISTGLISRLENEAQLAFILAHEAAHYHYKHSSDGFEFRSELSKDRSSYSDEDKFLASIQHTKNAEWEADVFAIDILKESPYSAKDVASVFDVLKLAYESVGNHPFPFSEVEDSSFQIAHLLEQKNDRPDVSEVQSEPRMTKEEARKYSSHPQLFERKTAFIEEFKSDTTRASQVPVRSAKFMSIQRLAEFDALYNYILEEEYLGAWILSNYLLKDSAVQHLAAIKRIKSMALNGLLDYTYFKNVVLNRKFDEEYPPSQYQVILRKLDDSRLNALVAREVWRLHQSDSEDLIIKNITDATILKAQNHFYKSVNSEDKSITGSKKRAEAEANMNRSFAGVEFQELKAALKQNPDSVKAKKEDTKADNKKRPQIRKMLMFSPLAVNIDYRKSVDRRIRKAYEMQAEIEAMTIEVGRELGIEIEPMQIYPEDSGATGRYNDYSLMVDWMTYLDQKNHAGNLMQESISQLADKYQADYISQSLYVAYVKRKKLGTEILFGIIPYLTPFYIHWQFNPYKRLRMVNAYYNLKTGEMDYEFNHSMKTKYKPKEMRVYLYHSLNQIKP
ncbi:MAG: hypothetical protein EP332_05380, partial [Bacteroidetes bacterium]